MRARRSSAAQRPSKSFIRTRCATVSRVAPLYVVRYRAPSTHRDSDSALAMKRERERLCQKKRRHSAVKLRAAIRRSRARLKYSCASKSESLEVFRQCQLI